MSCYGKDAEYPVKWRKAAKEYLRKHCGTSVKTVNPTDFYAIGKKFHKTEKEVKRFDLRKVRECEILLVNLKDLDKSLGTSDEMFLAHFLNHPVIGFLEEGNIGLVHPWKVDDCDRIEIGKDAMYKALDYIKDYYIDC